MRDRDLIRQAKSADRYRNRKTGRFRHPEKRTGREAIAIKSALAAQTKLLQIHQGAIHLLAGQLRLHYPGADLDDLVQAGGMGLLYALRKFSEQHGCEFITYAYWWIKQYMQREVKHLDIIYVPRGNRPATSPRAKESQAKIKEDADSARRMGSLSGRFRDDDDQAFQPAVRTQEGPDPDELAELADAMSRLDPRSRLIVEARYEGQSLEEVGNQLHLSKERVRQLQAAAVNRLRLLILARRKHVWWQNNCRLAAHLRSRARLP